MGKRRAFYGIPILTMVMLGVMVTSASGTTLTSPIPTYTGTIEAESEGSTTLDGVLDVTCNKSTVKGAVEQHGAGVTAKGNLSSLSFGECDGDTVEVKKAGSLEIHATGSGNGTVTSSGAEITIIADTIFGNLHCIFTTTNTHIGTLTGATGSSGHATLHIDSAQIPRTGGIGGWPSGGGASLCGSSGEWTGSYKVTSPTGLGVDA